MDYSEVLSTINDSILTLNQSNHEILQLLHYYQIAIFIIVFSLGIIVALMLFDR